MFGWLRPRCPVDVRSKTWIELRMAWLAGQLGLERMRSAEVVLPTPVYFPDAYHGGEDDARRLFERLCGYAGIDPASIGLKFFEDEDPAEAARRVEGAVVRSEGAAGFYEHADAARIGNQAAGRTGSPSCRGRATVHLARSLLADPSRLVAAIVHELSHHLLVGSGRLSGDEEDHEPLTDLLPVFLGLGVFGANAVLREGYSYSGVWHRWMIGTQGYLKARHFGYAFALFAWFRGERRPAWAGHLRLDARATMAAGLKYLERTGDSVFHPDSAGRPYADRSTAAVVDDLRTGSDGFRLAALWELRDRRLEGHVSAAVEAATEALAHEDPILRGEAAGTLDQIGPAARTAVPALLRLLSDSHARVRMAAAFALGNIGSDADEVVPDLIALLSDRQPAVANAASWALARFGRAAAEAGPKLVRLLRLGLVECEFALVDQSLETLCAVCDDPERIIVEHLIARDEVCRRALAALEERRQAGASRGA